MTERRTAWEIADDMANAFDQETGEVDHDRWEALELELADKAEAIHAVVCMKLAEGDACKQEAERLTARGKAAKNRAAKLKSYLLDCLHRVGLDTLRTPKLTVIRRAGSERAEVPDVEFLDPAYIRTTQSADKAACLRDMKAGKVVRGAELVRGPESITFK